MTSSEAPHAGPGVGVERVLAGDRTPVLLDVLMVLSVLVGLSNAWTLAQEVGASGLWVTGYLALVLAMAVLWGVRRVRERRTGRPGRLLVVALDVVGVANLFLGGGAGAWPLFLMALLATVAVFGRRSGVVLGAGVLVLQGLALLQSGGSPQAVAVEVGSTALVFAFGLLLAWLLAERSRQLQRIGALLDEVQQGLATEIELVLADERTRAARDLHDGLGHHLTLIGMELTFAERMKDRDAGSAWVQVGRARAEASEALSSMRLWVRALSPARIEGVGLGQGLDALAESFRGTGLDVVVRESPTRAGGPAPGLDRGSTLFVHRFVQEALTNALRHAEATRIDVTYGHEAALLALSVSDDGSPGRTDRAAPTPGFGLRNLRERAQDLGGTVTTTWSAVGLRVAAELPLTGDHS